MSKVVFDGVGEQPELNRITAKKNYASSSQSHKMGATAMFNDILHHLAKEKYPELLNEVGGLVAVRQHPVYAFQKIPIEGTDQYTHKFIGLFTVGADKGDKNFFGFSDSEIKKTAIRLEGVDHIKGVGFNYPWEVNGVKKIRYNAAKEALCIVTDSDPTKWIAIFEQSMAGVAETEAEIDAYLAEKWQPAFECAYYNNPLIVGVDMTLAEINANVEAFGNLRRSDDRPYSMCEFWIDGEYDVYYLDKETNRYEKNGINILTDLGIAEGEIAGLTIEEKNALFIQKRVERFRAQAKEYFNVTDSIYQLMFLFIILATDNFEKNMYPYLMALLWRFLQDDLDSIFSTDNQGLDTKKYSTELHDFTDNSKSAYVFKGEDSAFWQLIELAFPNECKQMGRDILQAMYDKASGGTTTTEKLLCFFDDYFFDRAQNYFTPSAYNDDTEYAYEEAWNNKEYVSSVDIHPLAQALGSHESTERAWLEKRIIYLQSKFSFGSFASSGSDLGVISFRTQQAQSFTLTPAIDCYPTIVSGDGNVINAKQRVMAGESVTLEGAGGSNTNVYIVGADWLSDIGDLKGLALDPSAVQKLSISSKRLRRIKVGDEVASEVTSALQQLDIQRCDCLETIDARNLTSLVGVVDLSKCPRLSEAYFGGSSASAIVIAAGSKIEKLELPDTISVLDLRDAKFLQEINIGELANLNSLRLEGVPSLDGFEVLSNAYNAKGQKLQSIRLIGFTREGNSDDLDMLSNLANDKDKDGNEHPYNGIDAQGKPTDGHPVLEGTLNIDGYVYEDAAEAVKAAFPSIVFTPKGFYVRFADPEVQRIVASNWGDGKGITTEQVKAITDIGNKFQGNTLIETFDEFEKFEGVTELGELAFTDDLNLKQIKLPNSLEIIKDSKQNEGGAFKGTKIEEIEFPDNIKVIGLGTCFNCSKLNKVLIPEGLEYLGGSENAYFLEAQGGFQDCPMLEEITLPMSLKQIGASCFVGTNLKRVITSKGVNVFYLPNLEKATTEYGWEVFSSENLVFDDVILPKIEGKLRQLFFGSATSGVYGDFSIYKGSGCRKVSNLGKITEISSNFPFGDATLLEELVLPDTLEKIHGYLCSTNTKLQHLDFSDRMIGIYVPNFLKNCTGLKYLLCKGTTPFIIQGGTFNDTNNCPIYVPDASVEAYQSATNWVNYKDRIKSMFYYLGYIDFVDPAVRDICVANFDTDGDGKVSMEEAAAVTDIGTLFKGNTEITSFNEFKYFTGVTEIPASAFYKCTNLETFSFPNSINTLGSNAFIDTKITSIDLSKSTTYINKVTQWNPVVRNLLKISFPNCEMSNTYPWSLGLLPANGCIIKFNEVTFFNVTNYHESGFSYNGIDYSYEIDDNSTHYNLISGALFNDDCTRLLDVPMNSTLTKIPSSVVYLTKSCMQNSYEKFLESTIYGDTLIVESNIQMLNNCIGSGILNCLYVKSRGLIKGQYSGSTSPGCAIRKLYVEDGLHLFNLSAIMSYSNDNTLEYIYIGRPLSLSWVTFRALVESFTVPNHSEAAVNGLIIRDCPNLKTFKFHSTIINISSATTIKNCPKLQEIVIPSSSVVILGNANLLSSVGNENELFIYVTDDLVESYKTASNWNQYASQIKPISEMYIEFEDSEIERICVENFDVDEDGKLTIGEAKQVTDIGTIFQNNTSITKFNELEYFKNVTELAAYAFHESSLSDINLNNISSLKGHTFRTCKNLRKLVFKNCVSITGFIAFYSNVETVIFKNGWIDNNHGYNFSSSKLTSLVVCGDTISSLHTTDLENTPIASGAGYIYVPDNLVNDYKAATNWNAYASQIKPLKEYGEEILFDSFTIEHGFTLSKDGTITSADEKSTVGFIPSSGATTLTVGVMNTDNKFNFSLSSYKEDGSFVEYKASYGNPITITLKDTINSNKLKCTFPTPQLIDTYIMNADTGEYLWKGSNV